MRKNQKRLTVRNVDSMALLVLLFGSILLAGLSSSFLMHSSTPSLDFSLVGTNSGQTEILPSLLSADEKYDSGLAQYLGLPHDPDAIITIILLTENDQPATIQNLLSHIQTSGGTVRYVYSLISGIACTLPAKEVPGIVQASSVWQAHLCTPFELKSEPDSEIPSASTLDTENWWLDKIGMSGVTQTGKGVKIAILDSGLGINASGQPEYHMDFGDRVVLNRNFAQNNNTVDPEDFFDDNGHGTHVSGIAAGNGTASAGKYRGVAVEASIMNIKVANWSGSIDPADVVAAIEYAVEQNADVISMSFGDIFPDPTNPETLAVQAATRANIPCIVSAGNSGPGFFTSGSPASAPDAITVGAINKDGDLAEFSSWGPIFNTKYVPDICAPGDNIISTEGLLSTYLSVMKYFFNEIIEGSGYDNYIPLSGTSMATPFVTGAVALIKEKYPTLTPEALRWVLTESASPIPEDLDKAGAGILNVSAAIQKADLLVSQRGNVNNITFLGPDKLPFQPFDLLRFPGDIQAYNFSVFSGIQGNFTVTANTTNDISVNLFDTDINCTAHNRTDVGVTIEILLNASIGGKTVEFNVTNTDTWEIVDTVLLEIDVAYPKARVLFESFHGLNDYLYSFPLVDNQIQYYEMIKQLTSQNISCTYFMNNWTTHYDADLNGSLLTPEILSQHDILVLLPPILPYTQEELDAIKDFHDTGKSVLLVATSNQSFSVQQMQAVLTKLNADISLGSQNHLNMTDSGFTYSLNSELLTSFTTDSVITQGLTGLLWEDGITLEVTGTAKSLITSGDNVLAAVNNRVFVAGGADVFQNGFFSDETTGGNHSRLVDNLFNYFLDSTTNFSTARMNACHINSTAAYFALYATTPTGIPINLSYGYNLNASLVYPNMTVIDLILTNETTSGLAINSTLILPANASVYTINISVDLGSGIILQNFTFKVINGSGDYTYATGISQAGFSVLRDGTSSLTVEYELSSTQASSVTLYAGSTANSHFNRKATTTYSGAMTKAAGTTWKYVVTPAASASADYYLYFADIVSASGYHCPQVNRSYYIVENNLPQISEKNSSIGSYSFKETRSEEGYIYLIPMVAQENVDLVVEAKETVAYEDAVTDLVVQNTFVLWFPFEGYINLLGIVDTEDLEYQAASGRFRKEVRIPSGIVFTQNGENISRSLVDSQLYYGLFYVTARDSEGGIAEYYLVLQIQKAQESSSIWTIVIIILGMVALAVFLLLITRKPKKGKKAVEDEDWDYISSDRDETPMTWDWD